MSNKHRQWAGALARDCGITMTTQTQAAHINGEVRPPNRRRYFRLPDDVREAIRAAYIAGKPYEQIERELDVSEGTIANATHDLPRRQAWRNAPPVQPAEATPATTPPPDGRPVRQEGESKQRYAARVMAWLGATDPAYKARVAANRAEGQRRAKRLRQLAKQRAEAKIKRLEEALKAAKSAPPQAPAPAPVAAVEPPWGFQDRPLTPSQIAPPPRPGFWRSVGMMLGLVRAP